ncbi:MAG: transposase [Saprospiraceae bacterium]|nr:transposase [Saprospiraceae bacterium]
MQNTPPDGINSGNSRNGSFKKNIRTTQGPVELDIPTGSNGELSLSLYPRTNYTDKIESVITSLYSRGMTTKDITAQIQGNL